MSDLWCTDCPFTCKIADTSRVSVSLRNMELVAAGQVAQFDITVDGTSNSELAVAVKGIASLISLTRWRWLTLLLWNCSKLYNCSKTALNFKTALKLLWNCLFTALKMLCNCAENLSYTTLKLLLNCSENLLWKSLLNCSETALKTFLKLLWKSALKLLWKPALKLLLNCFEYLS